MTLRRMQWAMLHECPSQILPAPQVAKICFYSLKKVDSIQISPIAHSTAFQIGPNILDRIQFRGIGWKVVDLYACLPTQIGHHFYRFMGEKSIPDKANLAANILLQLFNERDTAG